MVKPEIKLDEGVLKVLGQILNSRIGLALIVLVALQPTFNDIKADIREIKSIAEAVQERHRDTPDLLARIQEKILELCGQCRNCKKKEG